MALVPWTPAETVTKVWIDGANLSGATIFSDELVGLTDNATVPTVFEGSNSSRIGIDSASLNGLDTLFFAGSEYLDSTEAADFWNFLHDGTEHQIYIVMRPGNVAVPSDNFYSVLATANGGSQRGIELWWQNSSGEQALRHISRSAEACDNTGDSGMLPANEWGIVRIKADWDNATPASRSIYNVGGVEIDGNNAESAAPSSSDSTNALRIGSRPGGGGIEFKGGIAEIVITVGAFDSELDDKIIGSLYHKWGLEADLDASHPYKSAPPMIDDGNAAPGNYGEIKGTVVVEGSPVVRDIVAISYDKQEVDDGAGGTVEKRLLVGETRSALNGTYTLQTPGFLDAVVVLALEDYGAAWLPNHLYSVGERIRPTPGNETGYVYVVTIEGVSGASEPSWIVPTGGVDTMAVGTATVQAVPAWWSIAHGPIIPVEVIVDTAILPIELDPYFESVVALIHADAGDGSASSEFDLLPNDWNFVGTAQLSDAFTFDNSALSILLDGNSDAIYNTTLASGDRQVPEDGSPFTWEAMVYPVSFPAYGTLLSQYANGDSGRFLMHTVSDGSVAVFHGTEAAGSTNIQLTSNAWNHVALQLDDDQELRIYVNGGLALTLDYSGATFASQWSAIGARRDGGSYDRYFDGYIDEVRITHGVARYTDNFTPIVSAFPDSRFEPGREPTILDPYWNDVVTLYHFEEDTVGDIVNESDVALPSNLDTYSGALLSTSEFKFGAKSLAFPAESHAELWINLSSGAAYADRGSRDATVEFFIYISGAGPFFASGAAGAGSSTGSTPLRKNGLQLNVDADGTVHVYAGNLGSYGSSSYVHLETAAGALPLNTLVHVAYVQSGDVPLVFVDGVNYPLSINSGTYPNTTLANANMWTDAPYCINAKAMMNGGLSGALNSAIAGPTNNVTYVDELRVTYAARYSADFIVPAEAYPNFEYDPLEDLSEITLFDPLSGSATPVFWVDFSDFDNVVQTGGSISLVADQSASGYDIEQDVATDMPTVDPEAINGLDVAYFDGNDSLDYEPSSALGRNVQKVVAVIAAKVDAFDQGGLLMFSSSSGDSAVRFLVRAKNTTEWELFTRPDGAGSTYSVTTDATAEVGEWAIVTVIADYSTGEGIIRVNGEERVRSATLPTTTIQDADSTRLSVGQLTGGGGHLTGSVLEAVVEHDDADVEELEGYLAWKAGLALAADHKYKQYPPRA